MNPKKELLWGLWVGSLGVSGPPRSLSALLGWPQALKPWGPSMGP